MTKVHSFKAFCFIDDPQHKMNGFEFPAFAGNQAFDDQISQSW